ncbi:MAG: hypothetical protein EU542_07580, partial [Promethearchaeota archaeon]
NLGGSSKIPTKPKSVTHLNSSLKEHRNVSFIGRPFPLDQADEHLVRLKNWGYNCIRLLTTWEAIEHEGPEKYDREYLRYFRKILEKIGEHGLYCFIDPHQDVWSRLCGGDGAPGWTLEKAGLDYRTFDETEAAIIMHKRYPDYYNHLDWSQNYYRFATSTMFTLFFGGNDFAPGITVEGEPIQDYLQNHYCNALKEVAKIAQNMKHVLGFDIFNEPNNGFIGIKDLSISLEKTGGLQISPYESMITASGYTLDLPVKEIKGFRLKEKELKTINKNKTSCWLPNKEDIWKKMGIWKEERKNEPVLIKPHYFYKRNGENVSFFWDYLRPFINKYSKAIREVFPEAMIFIESNPLEEVKVENNEVNVERKWQPTDAQNIVNASHWYDHLTLYFRKFHRLYSYDTYNDNVVLTPWGVKKLFKKQLQKLIDFSRKLNNCPTLIGEFGIPFNFEDDKSFETGIWKNQTKALNFYHNLMDSFLLNFTLWNYTADNTNEWGDQWNLEDFSIFSYNQQDQKDDLNSGARAIRGFCRPFVHRAAGQIMEQSFNYKRGLFKTKIILSEKISEPSVIYVPAVQYPGGYQVSLSDGTYKKDLKKQLLYITHSNNKEELILKIKRE